MDYKRIIYKPGPVAQIILNRPECLNAISHPAYRELIDAFDHATNDENCRVIVHSGNGPCFSAGHDHLSPEASPMLMDGTIPSIPDTGHNIHKPNEWPDEFLKEHEFLTFELKKRWRKIPKPTIAMVHGYCIYGAFDSVAAMDLVFASEDALFMAPLGTFDVGVWDFGARKYKELLFEPRFLSAAEGYACGFVNRLYPDYEILEKETLAFANRIAENKDFLSIRLAKKKVNDILDIQGYTVSQDATWDEPVPARLTKAVEEAVRNAEETKKGIAQGSRALANLKAKLEAEKKYYTK